MSDFYRGDKHVVDKQTEEGDIGVFNKKDVLFLTFHLIPFMMLFQFRSAAKEKQI